MFKGLTVITSYAAVQSQKAVSAYFTITVSRYCLLVLQSYIRAHHGGGLEVFYVAHSTASETDSERCIPALIVKTIYIYYIFLIPTLLDQRRRRWAGVV